MRSLARARSLTRTLATRGATMWVLLRLLLSVVFALLRSSGADATGPNPAVIVVICAIVGLVDLRRRGEEMLWSNLGVSRAQLVLMFAVPATIGEAVLALVLR